MVTEFKVNAGVGILGEPENDMIRTKGFVGLPFEPARDGIVLRERFSECYWSNVEVNECESGFLSDYID